MCVHTLLWLPASPGPATPPSTAGGQRKPACPEVRRQHLGRPVPPACLPALRLLCLPACHQPACIEPAKLPACPSTHCFACLPIPPEPLCRLESRSGDCSANYAANMLAWQAALLSLARWTAQSPALSWEALERHKRPRGGLRGGGVWCQVSSSGVGVGGRHVGGTRGGSQCTCCATFEPCVASSPRGSLVQLC